MTLIEFLDRNLKLILGFITIAGLTGWFGVREAYLSSNQFYGMWQAFLLAPSETIIGLIQ